MENRKYIGYEIKGLSNQFKRVMDRRIQEAADDLTSMQLGVLNHIARESARGREIFQRDIEEEFHIRRSTATGILQLMEKKGYIRREPVARDARLKRLVLTERAEAHQKRVFDQIQEVEAAILNELTEEELDTLFRLMEKISDNLDRMQPVSGMREVTHKKNWEESE